MDQIYNENSNVIFLISLPRSGSTLLQQLVGQHSEISTTPEPWVLLPLIKLFEHTGNNEPFDINTSNKANLDFFDGFEDKSIRQKAVKAYADTLYNKKIQEEGKKYFLDKSSRYYLVLDEIKSIYPSAKFLFLYRNPLAVLLSYLDVMIQENFLGLSNKSIASDLLEGYVKMIEFHKKNESDILEIHYEELIKNVDAEMNRICSFVGLSPEEKLGTYDSNVTGRMVDPKSIRMHNKPVSDYVESWLNCDDVEKVHLMKGYLQLLGEDVFESIGYDFDKVLRQLEEKLNSLGGIRFYLTFSELVSRNSDAYLRFKKHIYSKTHSIQQARLRSYLSKNPKELVKYLVYR